MALAVGLLVIAVALLAVDFKRAAALEEWEDTLKKATDAYNEHQRKLDGYYLALHDLCLACNAHRKVALGTDEDLSFVELRALRDIDTILETCEEMARRLNEEAA